MVRAGDLRQPDGRVLLHAGGAVGRHQRVGVAVHGPAAAPAHVGVVGAGQGRQVDLHGAQGQTAGHLARHQGAQAFADEHAPAQAPARQLRQRVVDAAGQRGLGLQRRRNGRVRREGRVVHAHHFAAGLLRLFAGVIEQRPVRAVAHSGKENNCRIQKRVTP